MFGSNPGNDGSKGSTGKNSVFISLISNGLGIGFRSPSRGRLVGTGDIVRFSTSTSRSSSLRVLVGNRDGGATAKAGVACGRAFARVNGCVYVIGTATGNGAIDSSVEVYIANATTARTHPAKLPSNVACCTSSRAGTALSICTGSGGGHVTRGVFMVNSFGG